MINIMWKKYKLSDIGTIVGGATPSTTIEKYYGGDIPWLTPKDLSSSSERYIDRGERNITTEGLKSCSAQVLPIGSVLFSSRAPIGYIAIAKKPIATNQGFKSIIPNKDTNSLFLYYLLKYNKVSIESMGSGTTFKEVSGATMKNIEVLLPPLAEQERIAGILGALDDKIECNNRINRNLEEQAAVLFRRWFVDFEFPDPDPTSPTYGKPYRSAGGKMQDSPLGSIPKGWKIGTLGEIIDVRDGTHNSPKQTDRGKFLITSKHLKSDGTIDFNSAYRISEADYNEINKRSKVDTNDILFSMIGTIGNMLLVECENIDFAIKNIALFKTSKNIPMSYFLYLHFKSNCFIEYLNSRLAGSTQQYITLSSLRSIPILISSDKLLNEFTSITEPLFKTMSINRTENQTLATLRDTLLPKLMNNEI